MASICLAAAVPASPSITPAMASPSQPSLVSYYSSSQSFSSSASSSSSSSRSHSFRCSFLPAFQLSPRRTIASPQATRGAKKLPNVVCMAPEEEKLTRRNPLDFPIEWERPKPGRRPDVFPQFSPMKTPLPPPMPYDPPEEDEEEEEKKEEEDDPDKEEEDQPEKQQ